MSTALQARDVNLPMEQPVANVQAKFAAGTQGKTQTVEPTMRKTVVDDHKKQATAYVSPSDAIQSPASQKLAGFKQRQINRQMNSKKPAARTLFAQTLNNNESCVRAQDPEAMKDQQA
ncbi:uncharacterized protein K489DRAFT_370385 [Dissoconium aciculare CBS 342.82]|uniref:Uncharacterized protein n=1 Tax=Dissoconium aciculare CBS 342.82 TaxID=1314786 RepID=A0A6J3M409_9PEZI|nr:uncharacterized protein K489DRAFT_370385 [Dissoconium aciculare CBS 342.82]KAF1822760.1 hypothetical protein K489DRAFT_370385 [Dissoconium aciculare CBS 342.82]